MDREKFNAVCNYFETQDITIPTEVKNAIEDVFLENDNIMGVECYHQEDIDQFQDDLTLVNNVKMFLNGHNEGTLNNIWTYYGNTSYSFSEKIVLCDDEGNKIEDISTTEAEEPTTIFTPNEWVVTLYEVVNWNSENEGEKLTRETKLYIYCPMSSKEEDDDYSDIYNEIKNNGEL